MPRRPHRAVETLFASSVAVALLALFFALGGASFAADATRSAVKLISGKNVKNSSLTTKDIKNGSLLSADLGTAGSCRCVARIGKP